MSIASIYRLLISVTCTEGINGYRRASAFLSLGVFIAGGIISTVPQGSSQGRVERRELAHSRLEKLAINYVSLYSSLGVITSRFLGEEPIGLMVR